jgi:hypothetical protein
MLKIPIHSAMIGRRGLINAFKRAAIKNLNWFGLALMIPITKHSELNLNQRESTIKLSMPAMCAENDRVLRIKAIQTNPTPTTASP